VSKEKKFEITPKVREELDSIVRKAAGKDSVDQRVKSCLNPKWHRYEFWGTAKGNVVNLNVEAKTAELMDEKCKTVKDWRRLQARKEKRAEAKLVKANAAVEKVAAEAKKAAKESK
jgi:hypothetical protein